MIYLGVTDAKIRVTMLKAGEIDMARLLPPASVSDLEKNPNIVVYKKIRIGRVLQLMLNTEKPTLADKRVRWAINYAINRKLICETLLEGIDEPATGPFSHELM